MKKFLLIILFLCISPFASFAVEDTTTAELISQSEVKAEEIEALDQIEQTRQKEFENQLGFTLPQYTDNPSYVITFVDPSPQKSGVQIEIDEKEYTAITSPYTLPALGIGQHTLKFRFNDKDGNVQLLEYTLIIIPRAPIISPPVSDETSITIKGTGLSSSDILIFLSSNTFTHRELVQTDSNGDWTVTVTPQEGLASGIYTLTAYTRKYGYASELSEPTVFEVGSSGKITDSKVDSPIFFSFGSINMDNVIDIFTNNPHLIILTAGSFFVGAFLALLIRALIKSTKEESVFKKVEGAIKSNSKSDNQQTLRELFEGKTPVKEEPKVEIKEEMKKEKVITKEDFLKNYKDLDPDDGKGKEKIQKKLPKIKISLTTREE